MILKATILNTVRKNVAKVVDNNADVPFYQNINLIINNAVFISVSLFFLSIHPLSFLIHYLFIHFI